MAAIPLKYTFRNLFTRKLTTALTVTGIALVVFVFTAVLMLAYGLQRTLVSTGSPNNVIMLRKGSDSELMSGMSQEIGRLASTLPEIARNADGKPIASGEVVVIINLHKIGSNDMGNISVRGVSPGALQLRPVVHLIEGRMFNIGSREVIVGTSVNKHFQGGQVGQTVRFGASLRVDRGDIVGLTIPTWAPAFAQGLPASNAWRASREPGRCTNPTDVRQGEPQQKVGGRATYGCRYATARLLYTATVVEP